MNTDKFMLYFMMCFVISAQLEIVKEQNHV